jgi:hypothetical protein
MPTKEKKTTEQPPPPPPPPSAEALQPPLLDYVIHENKTWEAIGHIQEQSRGMIPSLLGQGPHRIDRHIARYKVKVWEALLVRDGPILFGDLLRLHPYYLNLMVLWKVYLQSRNWNITIANIANLQENAV